MHAVAALLDESNELRVKAIWASLDRLAGLHELPDRVPYPHLSFVAANSMGLNDVFSTLDRYAAGLQPFTVQTSGLGIFPGSDSVLHLSVVRDPGLTLLHAQIVEAMLGKSTGMQPYYTTPRWMPHITLAQHDVTPDKLGEAIAHLAQETYEWHIRINTLAVLQKTNGKPAEIVYRATIGG